MPGQEASVENPFVFGEIVEQDAFVDRELELADLMRDVGDGQKIFLLSPRRFGKSSLVSLAFLKLRKRHIRTVIVPVSSYTNYAQFLEGFAERVIRAAGPWNRVKDWMGRFLRRVRPEAKYDALTGEIEISLGRDSIADPSPVAPHVFALPGELAGKGGFRMAICLDEFQEVSKFDGGSVEIAIRNEAQRQREVGYVFSGSQPALMEAMLAARRPFHKAGPRMFLDKIPADAWREFIQAQFRRRNRILDGPGLDLLLATADLIPYDVQRLAHELWDEAELKDRARVGVEDVESVILRLLKTQGIYFERAWEQLPARQRGILLAMAERGSDELLSQKAREEYQLGPASSAQKSIQALVAKGLIDRYQHRYFFLDPLFSGWILRATNQP